MGYATWSLRLRVVSATTQRVATLELVRFWRAQDPETEWDLSDFGWTAWWQGNSDSNSCAADGSADPGSKSPIEMLHEFGCVTTSDFGSMLKTLNGRDLSQVEADRWSESLSTLINETTSARKNVKLP